MPASPVIRPRIFIGSSSEGLDVASVVKTSLSDMGDCFLWTDNIFRYNQSFFDTLLKEACFFDFGLLIATKDDYLRSRKKPFQAARDNIIFEFGLFLGRLGANRAFILQERGTKLPSDLMGITVPVFEREKSIKRSKSLQKELDLIRDTIRERIALGELGLLPSTALAIGYYYNFVLKVCEELYNCRSIVVRRKKCSGFELTIVIPRELDADLAKRAMRYTKKHKLEEHKIHSAARSYPLYINYEQVKNGKLKLYDIPTTLSGVYTAIEMHIAKSHVGKDHRQKLLEQHEINNFKLVLDNLIQNNTCTRDHVKIVDE